MRPSIIVLLMSCMAVPLTAPAADEQKEEHFVEVPPPPPPVTVPEHKADTEVDSDEQQGGPEPEVTIIQKHDAKYEEYRLNGRLYMVKVVPLVGPPYYFVDRDGDGLMESRISGRASQPQIPQWVILSW